MIKTIIDEIIILFYLFFYGQRMKTTRSLLNIRTLLAKLLNNKTNEEMLRIIARIFYDYTVHLRDAEKRLIATRLSSGKLKIEYGEHGAIIVNDEIGTLKYCAESGKFTYTQIK